MTPPNNDALQDFNPSKFFARARRLYIEEPLKELGFKKYKSSVIARLTPGAVFQFLDFQKTAYEGHDFTVNVAIRPLFCPNKDNLMLSPGNRLGSMATKSKKDKWWEYSTQAEGEKGFADVFNLIKRFALPFFDATQTSADIISSYEKNIFGISKFGARVAWGSVGWEDFDLGHIYLHAGQIKKAIKHFSRCHREFRKDERDWAHTALGKCIEIKGIITSGQASIDQYLAGIQTLSKENLKLASYFK